MDNTKIGHKIKIEGKSYHLAYETFEVLAKASSKLFGEGSVDYASAGAIIFDSLYLENQKPLAELKEPGNVKLYFNLCYRAGQIVEFMEDDIKKKSETAK